jgi:hypothetical protein
MLFKDKKRRFTCIYLFRGAKPYVWVGKAQNSLLRSMRLLVQAETQPRR